MPNKRTPASSVEPPVSVIETTPIGKKRAIRALPGKSPAGKAIVAKEAKRSRKSSAISLSASDSSSSEDDSEEEKDEKKRAIRALPGKSPAGKAVVAKNAKQSRKTSTVSLSASDSSSSEDDSEEEEDEEEESESDDAEEDGDSEEDDDSEEEQADDDEKPVPPAKPKKARVPRTPKAKQVKNVTPTTKRGRQPKVIENVSYQIVAVPVGTPSEEKKKAGAELEQKALNPTFTGLAPPTALHSRAIHQKNNADRLVESRAHGVLGAIYVGFSHGGQSVLHYWYCVEDTKECIASTQNDGRVYTPGEFYAINVVNGITVDFKKAVPVHFHVPDLPPAVFDRNRAVQLKNLACIGIVCVIDAPRQVGLKTGGAETIREMSVMVPQNGVMVPIPVSLWGSRATGAKLVVGEVIWLLNCKTDNFLGFVRLSLGDAGTILTSLKTEQAMELLKTAKTESSKVEMPSGLKPL